MGRVFSMGLMCGVIGNNIGHELGHRSNQMEQLIGELLLLAALNTHFLPYHNEGHHRNMATANDAATAKKNRMDFTLYKNKHRSFKKLISKLNFILSKHK